MPKQAIQTPHAPPPVGPYSQALRVGDFIYVAGQGPGDVQTGRNVEGDIEAQTHQTLKNVQAILRAGGADMGDVVKATVHLSDLANFARFNAVYATYFPDPKPVRTTVASGLPNILVEIDVVAYVGAASDGVASDGDK